MVRKVVFFKHYFFDFFDKQSKKIKEKIDFVLDLLSSVERVPEKYFKHLEGTSGLYEIRVNHGNNTFRIFCCFDEGRIVVLFSGFQKKTNKTPKSEIDRALKIKNEYFNGRLKNNTNGKK